MTESRRKRGLDLGGGRVYGYENDRVTLNPEEATRLREMADRILAGEAAHYIARDFNARHVAPPRGQRWTAGMIRRMLSNTRYAGFMMRNGDVIGTGVWEPIFTRATFEALKVTLQIAARPRGGRPAQSLLSGIARCGTCETPVVQSKASHGFYIYRCNRYTGGCGRVSRKRDLVDAYVVDKLLASVNLEVSAAEIDQLKSELQDLEHQQAVLNEDLHDLRERYSHQRINAQDYYFTLDELRRQERIVLARYDEKLQHYLVLTQEGSAKERWDALTLDQQRAFIKAHVSTILIHRAHRKGGGAAKGIEEGEVYIVFRKEATMA